jgi:hypothetical protein
MVTAPGQQHDGKLGPLGGRQLEQLAHREPGLDGLELGAGGIDPLRARAPVGETGESGAGDRYLWADVPPSSWFRHGSAFGR